MDSMSNLVTPYSNCAVKGVKRFLTTMGVISSDITPVPVKASVWLAI